MYMVREPMTTEETCQLRAWEIVAEFARDHRVPSFIETADCASEVLLRLLDLRQKYSRVTAGLEWQAGRNHLINYIKYEARRQHEELPEE